FRRHLKPLVCWIARERMSGPLSIVPANERLLDVGTAWKRVEAFEVAAGGNNEHDVGCVEGCSRLSVRLEQIVRRKRLRDLLHLGGGAVSDDQLRLVHGVPN